MGIESLKFTNKILLIFAITLALYILKVLSFIFVPLAFACFIAIMLLPFMRWASKQKLNRYLALALAMLSLVVILYAGFQIIKLSGQEVLEGRAELFEKLDAKVGNAIEPYVQMLDIKVKTDDGLIKGLIYESNLTKTIASIVGPGLIHIKNFLTSLAITIFFLVLILAGSINFKVILQETLFNRPAQVLDVFVRIETSISKFVSVKILTSLITGVLFSVICWIFGVSFPLLWGVLAFCLNFIQMLGSIFVTILVSLMALVDIDQTGMLIAAICLFIAVQTMVGSVLEPILMGKSFKINIVMVLIMLLFWGFLWGVAGMMLAVPMAVLIKILCEQFEPTQGFAKIMS